MSDVRDEMWGFRNELLGAARALVRSEDDAEDLVQDTFVKALSGLDTFEPGTNLRAWLHTILQNAHIDTVRKARREPGVLLDEGESMDDFAMPGQLSTEDQVVLADEWESWFADLPESTQRMVRLRVDGYTYQEIAEAMGMPLRTVANRLERLTPPG